MAHTADPTDPPEPPGVGVPRPVPTVDLSERARAWLAWFGLGRLVLTALAVAIVAGGGFWLVRAPAPSAEATLPVATVPAGGASVTLPPPSTTTAPATTGPVPTVGPMTVHVAGSVAVPGVYELSAGERVHHAIARAGGATTDADLDALNLAEPLADGQRLYVPAVGALDHASIPVLTPSPGAAATGSDAGAVDTAPAGPVDLNAAGVDELDALPGVGPATAQAIVDDRERNGPFVSVDDLERVPGIGPSKLAALRDLVTV
ncbi:MAG: ComEA family DNA-binding protein [Ilumatobacter sp.]|nr:ComEA family DNA-binding protein [Ilumatobacter sp.]